MKRAKSICRVTGCNTLIDEPGYCDKHKHVAKGRFKGLRKAPGSRSFYQSKRWTDTSKAFRRANPLCMECKRGGVVRKSEMVHHTTERLDLIARGDSPYDWQYLEALCNACHNKELRKRGKVDVDKVMGVQVNR